MKSLFLTLTPFIKKDYDKGPLGCRESPISSLLGGEVSVRSYPSNYTLGLQRHSGLMHSKLGSCSGMKPVPCLAYLAPRVGGRNYTAQLAQPELGEAVLLHWSWPGMQGQVLGLEREVGPHRTHQ